MKFLIFLNSSANYCSPYMPIIFCDAGKVPFLRYFDACIEQKQSGDGRTDICADGRSKVNF